MGFAKTFLTGLLGLGLAAAYAAEAPAFEKPPAQALKMLKGAKGKPVRAGAVFVNGAFLKGPYVVARYGNVLRVNGEQVSGQIVPWKQFLAASGGGAAAPAPKPAAAAPAPAAKPATAVDDLFDDAPAAKPAAKAAAAKAPEPEPEVEGDYTPNARTKALLKRVNAARTDVNRKLLDGCVCFFGPGYGMVAPNAKQSAALLAVLPEALRDAESGRDLASRLRAAGFAFLPQGLCDDLYAHSRDYVALQEWRRKAKEDAEVDKLLQGGGTAR